ncbi:MAG TPA: electron transfer flavoprotein subunit alpha/FixB family protein [Haloplasmataceae bacterium]
MSRIKINYDKLKKEHIEKLQKICPFNAFELVNDKLIINSACRVCKMCVKKGPEGVCEFIESQKVLIDKTKWQGITVYAEHNEEDIHPVTFELIGKAKELAQKTNQEVHVVLIGYEIIKKANLLLEYGVDKVFTFKHEKLHIFNVERFTNIFSYYIENNRPSSILIGATSQGRAFAPRIAARFKTGLTADCTILDIKENTDLVQIRPAFGGNIMASIITSNSRPQIATVRYKIFNKPEKTEPKGVILEHNCEDIDLNSQITFLQSIPKTTGVDITEADIIISCGRGIKNKEELKLVEKFADMIGAELACTRPLIENGWFDPRRQIGLSGRTVAPKLLINLGISGSVQYEAGIKNSEYIISINIDKNAPIMDISHLALVGDVSEIISKLMDGEFNELQ